MSCKCYHADRNFLGGTGVCWGTKECEACFCNGDEAKCDFYEYVRNRAKKIITNADRIRAMSDEELATKMSGLESFALACGGGWPPEKWLEWLKKPVVSEDDNGET